MVKLGSTLAQSLISWKDRYLPARKEGACTTAGKLLHLFLCATIVLPIAEVAHIHFKAETGAVDRVKLLPESQNCESLTLDPTRVVQVNDAITTPDSSSISGHSTPPRIVETDDLTEELELQELLQEVSPDENRLVKLLQKYPQYLTVERFNSMQLASPDAHFELFETMIAHCLAEELLLLDPKIDQLPRLSYHQVEQAKGVVQRLYDKTQDALMACKAMLDYKCVNEPLLNAIASTEPVSDEFLGLIIDLCTQPGSSRDKRPCLNYSRVSRLGLSEDLLIRFNVEALRRGIILGAIPENIAGRVFSIARNFGVPVSNLLSTFVYSNCRDLDLLEELLKEARASDCQESGKTAAKRLIYDKLHDAVSFHTLKRLIQKNPALIAELNFKEVKHECKAAFEELLSDALLLDEDVIDSKVLLSKIIQFGESKELVERAFKKAFPDVDLREVLPEEIVEFLKSSVKIHGYADIYVAKLCSLLVLPFSEEQLLGIWQSIRAEDSRVEFFVKENDALEQLPFAIKMDLVLAVEKPYFLVNSCRSDEEKFVMLSLLFKESHMHASDDGSYVCKFSDWIDKVDWPAASIYNNELLAMLDKIEPILPDKCLSLFVKMQLNDPERFMKYLKSYKGLTSSVDVIQRAIRKADEKWDNTPVLALMTNRTKTIEELMRLFPLACQQLFPINYEELMKYFSPLMKEIQRLPHNKACEQMGQWLSEMLIRLQGSDFAKSNVKELAPLVNALGVLPYPEMRKNLTKLLFNLNGEESRAKLALWNKLYIDQKVGNSDPNSALVLFLLVDSSYCFDSKNVEKLPRIWRAIQDHPQVRKGVFDVLYKLHDQRLIRDGARQITKLIALALYQESDKQPTDKKADRDQLFSNFQKIALLADLRVATEQLEATFLDSECLDRLLNQALQDHLGHLGIEGAGTLYAEAVTGYKYPHLVLQLCNSVKKIFPEHSEKLLRAVLTGKVRELRYDVKRNIHLRTIAEAAPEFYERWSKMGEASLPLMDLIDKKGRGTPLNEAEKEKILSILPKVPLVKTEVDSDQLEAMQRELEEVEGKIADPAFGEEKKSLVAKKVDLKKEITSCLTFQCVDELRRNINHLDATEVLERLEPLMLTARRGYSQELGDLIGAIKKRVVSENVYKDWKIVCTDDWKDMVAMGINVPSCQTVNGGYKDTLFNNIIDGKYKMVGIRDPNGDIVARFTFRLMWDEVANKPVLFKEILYPDFTVKDSNWNLPEYFKDALNAMGEKIAKDLGVDVVVNDENLEAPAYPNSILSLATATGGDDYFDVLRSNGHGRVGPVNKIHAQCLKQVYTAVA